MIVLLPPSEGKAAGGGGTYAPADGSFAALAPQREHVARALVDALARRSTATDTRTLGATGPLADRAAAAALAVVRGQAAVLPAWQRYTGVVWEHLDPATLTPARRRRIVAPSALLGLVRGDDPVPDHRLKFSVSLAGTGRLDRWWRPHLTAALTGHGSGPIVDLLPAEHRAAIDLDEVARHRRLVRVSFVGAGGARAAGHAAKAVKGAVARTLLAAGLGSIVDFEWEGWRAQHAGTDRWTIVAPR